MQQLAPAEYVAAVQLRRDARAAGAAGRRMIARRRYILLVVSARARIAMDRRSRATDACAPGDASHGVRVSKERACAVRAGRKAK